MSSIKQSEVFLESEADGWYERNKAGLTKNGSSFVVDTLCRTLSPFKPELRSILEIGCGNGAKLHQLCSFFAAEGKGVDPSAKAVADGNRSFGADGVQLSVATAERLPFEDGQFDLCHFGFCLYLVDRAELFRAIAEADRVLKPGGFLAITDFDPPRRHKRAYHHKAGVFSYKQSYADLFTESGHYYLLSKHSFSHKADYFTRDGDERISLTILHKELDPY